MLPNSEIRISPNGEYKIVGLEQTDNCHKLHELGQAAGDVKSVKKINHEPVYQGVYNKG